MWKIYLWDTLISGGGGWLGNPTLLGTLTSSDAVASETIDVSWYNWIYICYNTYSTTPSRNNKVWTDIFNINFMKIDTTEHIRYFLDSSSSNMTYSYTYISWNNITFKTRFATVYIYWLS